MKTTPSPLTLLTDLEVAATLGVSVSTIRRMRLFKGQGPKWLRIGKSAIRYRHEDVLAYIESRPSGGEMNAPPKQENDCDYAGVGTTRPHKALR
jgi:predicted DNA-binding transcriptional regulator AlpA